MQIMPTNTVLIATSETAQPRTYSHRACRERLSANVAAAVKSVIVSLSTSCAALRARGSLRMRLRHASAAPADLILERNRTLPDMHVCCASATSTSKEGRKTYVSAFGEGIQNEKKEKMHRR